MNKRRFFLAGNWKMNTNRLGATQLVEALVRQIGSVNELDIAVCPPFPYLLLVKELLAGSRIVLGAQNLYFQSNGAFTGEVSAAMLADCGCTYVILGHSERRHIMGETDESINRKLKMALEVGLQPILCVGELIEQREAGKTNDVVAKQLRNALIGVPPEQLRQVTIAYEPVWAIGTGKVATPQQAEETQAFLRTLLTQMYGSDLSLSIRIQYGGSVNAENAEELLKQPNVDGALIGGSSLKAQEFAAIIQTAVRVQAL